LTGRSERRTPWLVPPPEKPPRAPASDREAKLAKALRANLRRRKAGEQRPAKTEAEGKSEREG
jgi:hypothetical protein